MSPAELEELAKKIDRLSVADQLELAAGLIRARRGKLALPIVRRVSDELGALDLIGKL